MRYSTSILFVACDWSLPAFISFERAIEEQLEGS